MFILRLFDDEFMQQPIDARLLREGTITVGRDASTDWVLNDRELRLSRRHFEITADGQTIVICALGSNGVFDDATGVRLPDSETRVLDVPATLRFGGFRLVVDYAAQSGTDTGGEGQTLILSPPLGSTATVPHDYTDTPVDALQPGDGSLLDSFCQGAGLEPSAFAVEDPADVMRRAGAVYRQMVLGVGDLMAERERVRRHYQIARTTIGNAGNNPFKWGPTQRLALDLLLAEGHGFMSGPGALQASFSDIKKHLIATFRGLHASLRVAVAQFDPVELKRQPNQRPCLLQSRAATQCAEIARRHADLHGQITDGADGILNTTFVRAYDTAVAEIEGTQN